MAITRTPRAAMLALMMLCIASPSALAQKGQWTSISDGVLSKLAQDGKKIGYPGMTAGVTVDPSTGDVYMIVCDQGLWKSSDGGKTFARIDAGAIGGRCETGFALNFDPRGKRLACFIIYGSCASTEDAGATWTKWSTNHLDFGAVDWEATGQVYFSTRHESGGVLCLSSDAGKTWKNLGKLGADKKIVKEDREFKGLGLFDARSLMATRGVGLLRSTDGGESWQKVSDAKPTAPVMRVHKGIGYWMTDQGVIASKDRGATWELTWPIKAVFGPWFAADDKRIVVAGKEGFSESLDGGKTWAIVAPLPTGFNVNLVGPNYGWDPVHDVFYASSMGKATFRFER